MVELLAFSGVSPKGLITGSIINRTMTSQESSEQAYLSAKWFQPAHNSAGDAVQKPDAEQTNEKSHIYKI
tara:strand:+ start:111 stop:320 length:210 start_codon:yes stop_codon:yes gene_type:complete